MSAAPTTAPPPAFVPSAAAPVAAPRRALLRTNTGFRNLWSANLVSVFGDGLYFIALPWITYQHTHSGIATALTFVAGTLPFLLVGPLAGVYVDRWHHKLTLVSADLLRAAVLLLGALVLLKGFNLPAVIAVSFLLPVFSRFFVPAQRATTPLLVEQANLLPANALMEGANNAGMIAGPALGGILAVAIGGVPLLFIDALTFLASAAFLSRVAFPAVPRAATAERSVRRELAEGLQVVWRTPTLRMLCLLAPFANGCFGAVVVALPIWIARSARSGSAAYGVLMASVFLGSFVGSLLLVRYGKRVQRTRLVVGGLLVMGLAVVAFGLTHSVFAGALALGGLGAALASYNIGVLTLLQLASPPAQQGRVFSINEVAAFSLRPLLAVALGMAADLWSINGVVVLMGGVMVIAGTILLTSDTLRENLPAQTPPPSGATA